MNNNTIEFFLNRNTKFKRVLPEAFNTHIQVARYARARGIIERDDVGKVIVLKMLEVDSQEILVRAKNDVDGADGVFFHFYAGVYPAL